ncbi:MAG: hypothetical protein HPY53_13680 [Brevinematales bacterium]|nr:hypothetical protein [Brevinematales bacterium]
MKNSEIIRRVNEKLAKYYKNYIEGRPEKNFLERYHFYTEFGLKENQLNEKMIALLGITTYDIMDEIFNSKIISNKPDAWQELERVLYWQFYAKKFGLWEYGIALRYCHSIALCYIFGLKNILKFITGRFVLEYLSSNDEEFVHSQPCALFLLYLLEKFGDLPGYSRIKNAKPIDLEIYQCLVSRIENQETIEPELIGSICDYHLRNMAIIRPYGTGEFNRAWFIAAEIVMVKTLLENNGYKVILPEHELLSTPFYPIPFGTKGYDPDHDKWLQAILKQISIKSDNI